MAKLRYRVYGDGGPWDFVARADALALASVHARQHPGSESPIYRLPDKRATACVTYSADTGDTFVHRYDRYGRSLQGERI